MTNYSFDFSAIPDLDNNPNAKFRLYGYSATGGGGTWRLDNIVFCGTPIVTIDSVLPNPTNGDTTLTWHALENGNYDVRIGGTNCTDGTSIASAAYATSPSTVPITISGTALTEGANPIYVCLTDVSGNVHAAVSSVTKDSTGPNVTINQSSGQIDPASTLPVNFTVVFTEVVDPDTFVPADITHTGSATGVTWAIVDSGDHKSFTVRATALTGAGTLIPSLPANAVTDLAGNGNTASTSTDNSVTYTPITPQGIVISEFRTRGPAGANDEFIELYNPTNAPVDISSWKINASNDTGTIETRVTIPAFTILRSGQYYLIVNNSSNGGYSKTSVAADLTYGTGITDAGGIAILKADNSIVDQVGVGASSAYKEGTPLASLSGTSDQSYERKPGGTSDSCQDTNDNSKDFNNISTSRPQNYFTPLSLCGTLQSTPVSTTISITGHNPNPSLINAGVSVSVTVTVPFGSSIPTGIVSITGANTNCNITLTTASAGRGSCTAIFSSSGTKTLTATYLGDNMHLKSSTTASHQVNTSSTVIPTAVATPRPPPELVAINEFVPRPGHDWNNDGVVNVGDEYIELLNHGTVNVNLTGYSLDDEVNVGSSPFRLPSLTIRPGERIVFYGSETGLLLGDGGDGVRLLKPNGQLADAFNYSIVGYPDQSYCRLPDNGGADDWNQNCFPTPGLQNSLSGESPVPVNSAGENLYCPIADTLPEEFTQAECEPFGNNIWHPDYWDQTGWYGEKYLPGINGKWPVFAN